MFCAPGYNLFWGIFYVFLKRICILLLLGGVFCKCQFDPVGWCYYKRTAFMSLLVFCVVVTKIGLLKSPPPLFASVFISFFSSLNFCFVYFELVLFCVYTELLCILGKYILLSLCNTLLSLVIFLLWRVFYVLFVSYSFHSGLSGMSFLIHFL